MTDVALTVLGAVLLVVGFVGCVIPVLPGVVAGFAALLCLCPTPAALSSSRLAVAGVAAAVAFALDYALPSMAAKKFDCSRWGTAGCFVGTIAGAFFFPLGIILGPFLGAMLGELVAGRGISQAFRGGVGGFLGFLFGTFAKMAVLALDAYWFVRAATALFMDAA